MLMSKQEISIPLSYYMNKLCRNTIIFAKHLASILPVPFYPFMCTSFGILIMYAVDVSGESIRNSHSCFQETGVDAKYDE